MGRCRNCGSPCQNRYCRFCGPAERVGEVPIETGADRAYLAEDGPHRCDLCGAIVATRAALAEDCSEHGAGGDAA